jgi:hypothetical protein
MRMALDTFDVMNKQFALAGSATLTAKAITAKSGFFERRIRGQVRPANSPTLPMRISSALFAASIRASNLPPIVGTKFPMTHRTDFEANGFPFLEATPRAALGAWHKSAAPIKTFAALLTAQHLPRTKMLSRFVGDVTLFRAMLIYQLAAWGSLDLAAPRAFTGFEL